MGTLRLSGIDPAADKRAFSRQVGVLFVEDSLYKNLSPRANLVFQCRLHGLPKSRAEQVLADHASASVEKLGSSLARRLAFGRAILHQPPMLILADPFVRCDEASISLISRLIRQLAERDTAILILAEDDAHLATLCDTLHTLEKLRELLGY